MAPDHLVVRENGVREVATVEETVETASQTFARVEGDRISGWVEIPDDPAEPKHAVVCDDCGHMEEDPRTGQEVLVGRKENVCEDEGNARLLRDIHEAKRPTHEPRIEVTA